MAELDKFTIAEVTEAEVPEPVLVEAAELLSVVTWKGFYTGEDILKQFKRVRTVLAVQETAEIAGAGTFKIHEELDGSKYARVDSLGIDPKFQRIGLGRRIMNFVEEIASNEGAGEIILTPGQGSHQFYTRMGFVGVYGDSASKRLQR